MIAFFAFGLTDPNFKKIVTKPDNVPIVGLLFLVNFFLWVSMKQAYENDARMDEGKESSEAGDAKEKVLVWPDLVYIEFISLILCTILLMVWSILLKAPLEEPANPTVSPNPSKAPWYFLGLQEMLVYFDPWLAGVVFPTVIILGLMAIPYLDSNKKGRGYYSFKERKMAISIFVTLWLLFWIFLITVGTFLRGPNWNFFGPFEYWDVNKLEVLTNVNLSEYFYMIWFKRQVPQNIILRELPGFFLMVSYFGILPPLLAKTLFRNIFKNLGAFRYSVFVVLLLIAASLPMKMFLRWAFNIKYIIAIPEFFFNI
ncbi:MAG: cytochrome C [Candidatus Omnitrophica bacterium]|nr:cytochrome C [Candidatus Omnitrophota bacterium]